MGKLTSILISVGIIIGVFMPYDLGYGPATMFIGGTSGAFLGMLAYLVVSRLVWWRKGASSFLNPVFHL